eukprot:2563970-Pyramimonas_sp.AAC.1
MSRAKRWFLQKLGTSRAGASLGARIQRMSQAKWLFSCPARRNSKDVSRVLRPARRNFEDVP